MAQPQTFSKAPHRHISTWLITGIIMLMVQILLGGVTRLTGSGLSITEWKPLLGALPPLNQQAWQQSFQKYQQIAQFKQLNSGFTLADYKAIFFWEWLHREWARLMALVFIVPFCWFVLKKQISRAMIHPLLILFLLGGLQGIIGWVMVQSGLNDTDLSVSHIRLAVHFICALFLLCYLLWFTLKISFPHAKRLHQGSPNRLLTGIVVLLFFQLIYGALMAGTHAALYAPTWPDMDGTQMPVGLTSPGGLLHSLCYNVISIQFTHRNLAYLIALLIMLWFYRARNVSKRSRWIVLLLVFTQVLLGIVTLMNSMFHWVIYFAVLHQCVGMLLLMSLITALFFSKRSNADRYR